MKTLVKLVVWIVMFGSSICSLSCNTVEGMGEDIERGGEEIQEAVN
jgi:predicted small secreted protein